ncbi:hypothetical protein [Herbiconiux ginsengi]|uniref:Ribbon-helix-helix protein, copG family n=1 Tax=Herbiconiux ginsengi TaxID=381665 RepID=A0A1H3TZM8_9MICO|nr:hypothetical protein [Herbiconiux ginsengi]SDZ55548.1 hypothetical protein SAMN05216554_4612 [Herbiconiux ginsengi]
MSEPQIDRPSLADAFKGSGSGRAASLGGLLPKTTRPTGMVATGPAAARQKPTTPKPPNERPATPRRAAAQHEGVQNVAVYLEPDILTLVRAAKTRTAAAGEPDKTYDELLVDALDHIPAEQLRAAFAGTPAERSGGPLQRRTRRPRGSGGIQIQLRLDGDQRRALDELTADAGAPSRSALVATAYRLHLAPHDRES